MLTECMNFVKENNIRHFDDFIETVVDKAKENLYEWVLASGYDIMYKYFMTREVDTITTRLADIREQLRYIR